MTTVEGLLNDRQNNPHIIDFYDNPTGCDISGFGEGSVFLGSTEAINFHTFGVPITFTKVFAGEHRNITATATDIAFNTSEFSTCGAPYIVNSTADLVDVIPGDGFCSTGNVVGGRFECTLRAAIQESNARLDKQTVQFDIPPDQAVGGLFIIQVGASLPFITDPVVINATTQPGYQAGMPVVELKGPGLTSPLWGFQVTAGNSAIRGFSIYGFGKNGIFLGEKGHNVIESNIVGTNARSDPNPGIGEDGILILNSSDNVIGGSVMGQRNVISRNGRAGTGGCGIMITNSSDNRVIGNYIGTDVTGTAKRANGKSGVCLSNASFNKIGGSGAGDGNLISGNQANGIDIQGAQSGSTTISGNIIGLDSAGNAVLGNDRDGVLISLAGAGNLIGSGAAAGRNTISGNTMSGIAINAGAGGNSIDGNFIGTNIAGNAARPNGTGIVIEDSPMNRIGVDGGNMISGNDGHGLVVTGDPASAQIQDNLIGTDPAGLNPLGNLLDGVRISGARDTIVVSNVVADNGGYGVAILGEDKFGNVNPNQANANNFLSSNWIGAGVDGRALGNGIDGVAIIGSSRNRVSSENTIRSNGSAGITVVYQTVVDGPISRTFGEGNILSGNDIFGNIALGIDLGSDFLTANDPLDADVGANALQNFPGITNIVGPPLNLVQGTLNSAPNKTYTIEIFSNTAADPSGNGEGEVFEGAFPVLTNASGEGFFTAGFGKGQAGHCITATARDNSTGDTSEFSPCVIIPPPPPAPNLDYGDAPDTNGRYPTLLASNGARHVVDLGVFLGSLIDGDPDGQANADATGDNNDGSNDEGGVNFVGRLETFSTMATVEVSVNAIGMLDAWIDFNGDGDWDDVSDRIFADQALVPGINVLIVTVPTDAIAGTTFARFRFSTAGGLAPIGPALNGEVEDYAVEIVGNLIFGDGFE